MNFIKRIFVLLPMLLFLAAISPLAQAREIVPESVSQELVTMPLLLADGQFVFGPNVGEVDLRATFDGQGGQGSRFAAQAELIVAQADYFSVNPRVLVTILALLDGEGKVGEQFSGELHSVAGSLREGFSWHRYTLGDMAVEPLPSDEATLTIGQREIVIEAPNSASFTVASLLSEYAVSVQEWERLSRRFPLVYQALFPHSDPFDNSNKITPLAPPPTMQFPFPQGESWWFAGPHNNMGPGHLYRPWSSLDFVPPDVRTCDDFPEKWAVAAASGSVWPRTTNFGLRLDHGNGWQTFYYHLRDIWGRFNPGDWVNQNDFLGRVSCEVDEGGKADLPHVHFALLYNGEFVDIATSSAGTSLSGYQVYDGNTTYKGKLVRESEIPSHHYVYNDNGSPSQSLLNFTVKLRNSSSLSNFNHSAEVAVVILEPATQQILAGPRIVSTDSNGYVSLPLSGFQPGTYDICAKARHYLGQCRRNVQINPGEPINLDFSNGETTPAEPGDIDPYGQDNEINALDKEMIMNEYRTYIGQFCPPCRFDMNRDGIFNTQDVWLVLYREGNNYQGQGNFGNPFPGNRDSSVKEPSEESQASVATGFVRVEPTNVTKSVGEVFDASIFFDTGGNAVRGSDVKVYYDPAVLEVLDEDPSTTGVQIINAGLFPSAHRNRVDSSEGIIWFSASYDLNDEQFNGSGTLATLRFRVLAGTPFSTQVYPVVESNMTNESNAAQFDTAFDVLGSAAISSYTLNGTERPQPSISLSVGSNSHLNETLLDVTAQVNEPYNQIDCVDFNLVSEFDLPISVSDCEGGDGWSAFLDTSTLSDQTNVRMIGRVNLRTTQGDYSTTSENITLDRTSPNIVSSNFSPQTPSPGESVQVAVEIDDNLSQQIHTQLWVNRANDSSAHGEWVRVDERWIARAVSNPPFVDSMTWNTTGFDEGDHLILITAEDDAGTRNSWSTVQTVGSSTTCPGQYIAEYYSNQTLSGNAELVQCETWPINHNWTSNPPAPNIPSGNFSARWTGNATFGGGDVTFTYRSDDGMRAWLDNELIVDDWDNPSLLEHSFTRYVSSGEHEIKVEYYESGGSAVAQFRWEEQATTSCAGQFLAEYYSNQTLSGNADLVQCESWPINHNWTSNPPAPNIPSGNFSARWTGNATFQEGNYTFTYRSDDGMRAWLDNQLIIDNWDCPLLNQYSVTRYVSGGEHEIKVEYYESGGAAVAQFGWQSNRSHLERRLHLGGYRLYLPAITIDSSSNCVKR